MEPKLINLESWLNEIPDEVALMDLSKDEHRTIIDALSIMHTNVGGEPNAESERHLSRVRALLGRAVEGGVGGST